MADLSVLDAMWELFTNTQKSTSKKNAELPKNLGKKNGSNLPVSSPVIFDIFKSKEFLYPFLFRILEVLESLCPKMS